MDNPVAIDPLGDFSDSPSLDTTQDIENLLGIFSTGQKVNEVGETGRKNDEALLSESGEGITLYGASSESVEKVNASHAQVELSLNSSGYVSSGSPQDSTFSSQMVTVRPPSADQHQSSSGDSFTVDTGVTTIQDVQWPSVIHHGGSDGQHQQTGENCPVETLEPYNSPGWLREVYPELHSAWLSTSGSQFYQGGVRMLCTRCRTQDAAGFHEGLPLCEACRVGAACTVCRIRVASCFSHGLALCEADRVFLYRSLTYKTIFNKCRVQCPVTVQKWCGYCRLRTCLSAKGFRFTISASTGHLSSQQPLHKLRKYSGRGNYKELNFLPDSVNQDAIYLSPPEGESTNVNTYQHSNFQQSSQAYGDRSSAHPQAFRPYSKYSVRGYESSQVAPVPAQQVTSQPQPNVYDGSGLGLSNRKEGGSFGLNNDPERSEWVMKQQEKYLQHHLAIYRSRMKIRRV